MYKVKA